jgi:hypothetical protein
MKVVRDDAVLRMLTALPVMPSDPGRATELRARCRQQLRRRTERVDRRRRALDAAVALLSVAYLSQLARMAFLLSR